MTEGRKIAAILVADIVGYSRLMGAEEEATLARLRALRSEVFSPAVEAHVGRVVSRAGDGAVVEFRSVVEAVRCAIDITKELAERNAPLPLERRIEIRTGIHLGDVIETRDGDLFGDAVNIAARLEGICAPGGICLSEDAWRQVRDKLPEAFVDLGEQDLKNIARPMRVYTLGGTAVAPPAPPAPAAKPQRTSEAARAIPDAVIGVLDSVARLSNAHRPNPLDKALKQPAARAGVQKALGILETVERIVEAVTDRTARRDADTRLPPNPPNPPKCAPRAETAGRETVPRGRHRRKRGRDDTAAS